ncbi:MAG: hypothetical protein GC162_05230 [Planctomycetes bacterium]|nr:hypothetical protein [Planctomycetota bacterium]
MPTFPKPLRLVSYNILNGGLGRLDPIYETLAYLDADVIGLCEADDPAGAQYLADKLGMQCLIAESPNGPHHVAMLTRLPVVQMINLGVGAPQLNRAAMESVLDVDGEALRVVLMHLAPHFDHEADRLAELEAIFRAMTPGNRPTMLMGDLNAVAPAADVDSAALAPHRRQRLAERGGKIDRDVIARIEKAGYADAYDLCHPDAPAVTFTTGFPALRLDYIFLSSDLVERVVGADVERGGFAPYCSDHFPLWADLARPGPTSERAT